MIKFNKEEINLCKQTAEKHRKKLEYGDWYYYKEGRTYWTWDKTHTRTDNLENHFPLWTISDCLEFLRERNFEASLCYFNKFSGYRIQIWKPEKTQAFYSDYDLDRSMEQCTHKTPLEACLKAVLAVLEGK